MNIAFISHPACKLHEIIEHHPEAPKRLDAILDRLIASGLDIWLKHFEAPKATQEQLGYAHDPAYIEYIFTHAPHEGSYPLDPDTAMNPYSLDAALYAAGSVILAIDLVIEGKVQQAFCSIRPPGHHALKNQAMGFCIFNNIAIGAKYAIQNFNIQRVAIIDFDVHHGNGTENIITGEKNILFCSAFQHPFYPGSGYNSSGENIINIPLPAGIHGEILKQHVTEECFPKIREFKPELILVSAGFDGHREDTLAHWLLTEEDYGWLGKNIRALADEVCSSKVIAVLEGGYNLSALGRSVDKFISGLAE